MAELAYPSICLVSVVRAKNDPGDWAWMERDYAQKKILELYGSEHGVSKGEDYSINVDFGKLPVEAYLVHLKTSLHNPCTSEGLYKIASSATLCKDETGNSAILPHSLEWPQVRKYIDDMRPGLYAHNEKIKAQLEPVWSPGSELETGWLRLAASAGIYSDKFGSLISNKKLSISKQIENEGVAEALSDFFCLNLGHHVTTKKDFRALRNEGFEVSLYHSPGEKHSQQNALFLKNEYYKQTHYIGLAYPADELSAENANNNCLGHILPLI